jgi:hypothetical protein
MTDESNPNIAHSNDKKQEQWFEKLINSIKVDQLALETKTADKAKERLYNNLIEGKHLEMFSDMRKHSSQYFIEELVIEYISEINKRNVKFNELAFDLTDAKIHVWAEIDDEDESSEDGLFLAEAYANAKFLDYGTYISTTIVEKSDSIPLPSHYSSMKK